MVTVWCIRAEFLTEATLKQPSKLSDFSGRVLTALTSLPRLPQPVHEMYVMQDKSH